MLIFRYQQRKLSILHWRELIHFQMLKTPIVLSKLSFYFWKAIRVTPKAIFLN
jgi:hypothetical protein